MRVPIGKVPPQLDALLDAYDNDTLGDDPAEFDEWLELYDPVRRKRSR